MRDEIKKIIDEDLQTDEWVPILTKLAKPIY